LNRWSAEQDKTGERRLTSKLQGLSGPGLVLYGLTVTFAAVDWAMSLDPEWFSTMYGLLFMAGQGLAGMAFVIAVMVLLSQRAPMNEVIKPSHLHDLGKLMLAFLMIWAYFAFSQFLIIWAGNLPEEIPYYVRRLQSSWKYVGLALIVLHFALPFVLLLSRDLKRNGRTLSVVAIGVIVMRYVDLIWLTGPELHEGRFALGWMDLMLLAGIGGVWLWFFATELNRRPLLPIRDPEIESVFASGHGH
jgi:Ni/Fe-hydrogenase subunit HybB-like protein